MRDSRDALERVSSGIGSVSGERDTSVEHRDLERFELATLVSFDDSRRGRNPCERVSGACTRGTLRLAARGDDR